MNMISTSGSTCHFTFETADASGSRPGRAGEGGFKCVSGGAAADGAVARVDIRVTVRVVCRRITWYA
ncbi:hypothetical protein BCCH1_52590 [Burkholderia contaminans]|uniref:Uncharacterized protein n=1 Tax=Burkholderia contaminans TaxID=488447 RepID=A0A250LGR8_9BURK|nr:hypothetical protein BCCH1_52590 [Burkholderia contaminans]